MSLDNFFQSLCISLSSKTDSAATYIPTYYYGIMLRIIIKYIMVQIIFVCIFFSNGMCKVGTIHARVCI